MTDKKDLQKKAWHGFAKAQPVVKITWHLFDSVETIEGDTKFPVCLFLGRLIGPPKRAGDLLPGDVILVPVWVCDDEEGGPANGRPSSTWGTVARIDWPTSEGEWEKAADFRRASGSAVCPICAKTFFDHPADRRFPDEWQPGTHRHYSLTVLCDGDIVKL